MTFIYHKYLNIPVLAWLAEIEMKTKSVNVLHGQGVETTSECFFEGAHDGSLEHDAALKSTFCLATGGVKTKNGWTFFTPSHTLDRLYGIKLKSKYLISNSLPFILTKSCLNLDWSYIHYRHDFRTIIPPTTIVPLVEGRKLSIFYNINIAITNQLEIKLLEKRTPPPFSSFKHYIYLLSNCVQRIAANASSPNRITKYKPITTISTGYDSPACSVFAKNIGANDAITIVNARRYTSSNIDSGRDIAELLNFSKVIECNRLDYLDYDLDAEEIFYSVGDPEDIVFYNFKDILRGKILFFGTHGDAAWNCWSDPIGIKRKDNSGASMGEFRLHTDFITFPIAFFGANHHQELIKIGLSKEMEHWRLNNAYDRPIPRRIVEECGVPRKAFGQEKRAISIVPGVENATIICSNKMLSDLRTDINCHISFIIKQKLKLSQFMHKLYCFEAFTRAILSKIMWVFFRSNIQVKPHLVARKYMLPFDDFSFSMQWACKRLKRFYNNK